MIYNYGDTGTLLISFNFLVITFIEMIIIQLFLRQSLLSLNINSPVGKLLVSNNQSFTLFTNFSTELKKLVGIMIRNFFRRQ